jgi:hypothetical protein
MVEQQVRSTGALADAPFLWHFVGQAYQLSAAQRADWWRAIQLSKDPGVQAFRRELMQRDAQRIGPQDAPAWMVDYASPRHLARILDILHRDGLLAGRARTALLETLRREEHSMSEERSAAAAYARLLALQEETLTAIERLQQAMQERELTRDEVIDLFMLENRATVTAPQVVRAGQAARLEGATETSAAAVTRHNDAIPAVTAAAHAVVETIGLAFAACAHFVEVYDEQQWGIMALVAHDGQPAWPYRKGGHETLRDLLGRLANGSAWQSALLDWPSRQPTGGDMRACLDAVSGCTPFPPRLIAQYLQKFEETTP